MRQFQSTLFSIAHDENHPLQRITLKKDVMMKNETVFLLFLPD